MSETNLYIHVVSSVVVTLLATQIYLAHKGGFESVPKGHSKRPEGTSYKNTELSGVRPHKRSWW